MYRLALHCFVRAVGFKGVEGYSSNGEILKCM